MPHKSMTFNGIKKDWLILEPGRSKAPFAPIQRNLLTIPGMPGAYLQSSEIQPLLIDQPIAFKVKDDEDALAKKDELAEWLVTDEPVPLEFDDEPGRTYYAVVQNTLDDFKKIVSLRKGTIQFIALDGYSYGPELEAILPSDVVTLTNNGTADTPPVFELEVKEPVTFAMIQNQDNEYMMIGRPTDVNTEIVQSKVKLLDEHGEGLSEWLDSPVYSDGGTVTGNLTSDGNGITAGSFGTGTEWHGPVKLKDLGTSIQDFEAAMFCEFMSDTNAETFRIEMYLLDEYMNEIGKMAILDNNVDIHQVKGEGRVGPYTVSNSPMYIISWRNYMKYAWNYFNGLLRFSRVGNTLYFYIASLDRNGRHYDVVSNSYTDDSGEYLGRLKYIQIHIGTHGNTGYPGKTGVEYYARINNIKVTKLQQVTEDQTPYIAYPGDVITFDHATKDALINGEDRMDLKDFGASFFKLKKGENQLVVMPENSFDVRVNYRERFR